MKNSIFIIENDSVFTHWLSGKMDNRTTYSICDYINADEAYEDIATYRPKYVVLDSHTTGSDEIQAAIITIRALSPETDIIVLSKDKNAEAAIDLLRSGAGHFLSKDTQVIRHLLETIH